MGVADADVAVLSSLGCGRLIVMTDKFTSLKRFVPTLPNTHAYFELFTMAGAACVVQNVWAVQPYDAARFCESLTDALTSNQSLGVALFTWRSQCPTTLSRSSFRSFGVPLLKL